MTEIFEGLEGDQRDRIAALRKVGRFFWIDAPLSEATADDLGTEKTERASLRGPFCE